MKLKSKRFISLLSMLLVAILFGALGNISNRAIAHAEEADEMSGWYLLGNGAGGLADCSWQAYLADWRLTGTAEDAENYAGVWHTDELLLYHGDQFKLLWNDGSWLHPDESGWAFNEQVQFENLSYDYNGYFSSGVYGNIYTEISGYYSFTLTVTEEEWGVGLTLNYVRSDREVPPIVLYDMYVVGKIASVPTCNWPIDVASEGRTVEDSCIPMTRNSFGDVVVWTAIVSLDFTDSFKVYNTVSSNYYPDGLGGELGVSTAGIYTVSWVEGSKDRRMYQ